MARKPQKNKPLESEIKKLIVQYLNVRGIDAWVVELSGNTYTVNGKTFQKKNHMAGFPDIQGLIPGTGQSLHIEVKRPGGKLSQHQGEWIARLQASNAIAFIATSIDEVEKYLTLYRVLE